MVSKGFKMKIKELILLLSCCDENAVIKVDSEIWGSPLDIKNVTLNEEEEMVEVYINVDIIGV